MHIRRVLFLIAVAAVSCGPLSALESYVVGVVNFATCVTESKYGKQEQDNLENLRTQMESMIQDTEKQLKDISQKFEDPEFMDTLSPNAEDELKGKYQALNEDMMRYQNQYYQVLNQANYQIIQKLRETIAKASEKIARKQKLNFVMNKEACFYYEPDLEITSLVIEEMDRTFESDKTNRRLSQDQSTLDDQDPLVQMQPGS